MSRCFLTLIVFAVFTPGCVPVTEPVGDIDKAEVNKDLVGEWAKAESPEKAEWKVDIAPEVKGNPKGLMRAVTLPATAETKPEFFSLTTVGKHQYANLFLGTNEGEVDLGKEGGYAKWAKSTSRGYFVVLVEFYKDGFTIHSGDEDWFKKLMAVEKFEKTHKNLFETPTGWLTKYLDKNGRDKIFPPTGKNEQKYVRVKK